MATTFRCLCALALTLVACSIGGQFWPDEDLLREFEAAGPIQPEFDGEQIPKAPAAGGPLLVGVEDVLAITGLSQALPQGYAVPLKVRVGADGAISVGPLGRMEVEGKTLGAVEAALADAAYPALLRYRPTVLVEVAEASTRRVAVLGSVTKPGYHDLTAANLTLVGALTAAGGILTSPDTTGGARHIRISSAPQPEGEVAVQELLLPVKGLNIPFRDVPLRGGETVEVERWDPSIFTVMGLVRKPGAIQYPRDTQYNLLQAIAMAGGADPGVRPPYATVYRKRVDGTILAVTFGISGDDYRQAEVVIKPGDVISVQHTYGSWTRQTMSQALGFNIGVFYDPLRNR